jgi:hypothetical protein
MQDFTNYQGKTVFRLVVLQQAKSDAVIRLLICETLHGAS